MSTASPPDVHVLVVAKAPEPGNTKTRLGATVGARRAADLSAAALLDTVAACTDAFEADRRHLSLAGTLDRARDADRIRAALAGWYVRPQEAGSFADRLVRAHRQVPGRVVQVGTDTPQVTAEDLLGVAHLLDDAQAVLGPSVDGGWWVLALHDPADAECLRNVPMSSPETGARTLAALKEAGLSIAIAPQMRDVDVAEDAEVVAGIAPWTEFARQWRMTRSPA